MRTRLHSRWSALWLTAVAGAGALLAVAAPAAAAAVPRPAHVVIVIMENHARSQIVGSSSAPYINSLAKSGANFTQSYAITHPSEPNYLALFSGSTQGLTNDSCPHTYSGANLGSQLLAARLSFRSYSESMPSAGYTGCTSGAYARKHNPAINFTNVPKPDNLTLGSFPTTYANLPTVSYVDPNLNDDMHDGTIAQGDSWLKNHLGGYATWAKTHNSLLIVTWDEDNDTARNNIATIFTGQHVKTGTYTERITHYRVLRTIEDAYGLGHAGAAANTSPISDIWN
jgi:hypothetical protein